MLAIHRKSWACVVANWWAVVMAAFAIEALTLLLPAALLAFPVLSPIWIAMAGIHAFDGLGFLLLFGFAYVVHRHFLFNEPLAASFRWHSPTLQKRGGFLPCLAILLAIFLAFAAMIYLFSLFAWSRFEREFGDFGPGFAAMLIGAPAVLLALV